MVLVKGGIHENGCRLFPIFAAKLQKMRVRGIWEGLSDYLKLVILVSMVLLGGLIFIMIAAALISSIYGINLVTDMAVLSEADQTMISAMKLMQGITAIGTFVIPSLLAAFLFSSRPASFMKLDRIPNRVELLAVAGLVLATAPLINWMLEWNQHLALPEFLKGLENWMKESEDKAAGLIEAFMKMPEWSDLAVNLFIIGLLPAIGEEFLFRGLIQQLLKGFVRNTFFAILFTSILFSAIHLQFYGFFPRMMLGLLLGYLLEWSGSLWLPVLLHFLNNSIPVLMTWYDPQTDLDAVGIGPGDGWQVVLSLVLSAGLLFLIYRFSRQRNRMQAISVNAGNEESIE